MLSPLTATQAAIEPSVLIPSTSHLLAPVGLTQYRLLIHLSLLSFRVYWAYAHCVVPMQYVDYVGSWGPAIVGHAHPEVTEALTEQIKKVQSFCTA